MTAVFADTFYWYALANRQDQWHSLVLEVKKPLGKRPIVTTEEFLTEFLAARSEDSFLRIAGTKLVKALFVDPSITVLPQNHNTFTNGLELYARRSDKLYSLTDCISMNACYSEGLMDVLTNDHHFTQEGFTILISGTS